MQSFLKVFPQVLRGKLPPKMQRVLLIGSLSALLFTQKRSVKTTTLHKLNSVMELCNHEPALLMPMHLSKAIWRGDRGVEVFDMTQVAADNDHKVVELIEDIFSKIPAWLKYATDGEIKQDLRKLIEHRETILA